MYKCGKCGNLHTHTQQARACYGLLAIASAPAIPTLVRSISPRQVSFLMDLQRDRDWSGSPEPFCRVPGLLKIQIQTLSYDSAHKAISFALGLPKKKVVALTENKSILMPELMCMVPDGYYAAQVDDVSPVKFFRFSHPKSGQYGGSQKIQQGFGTGYGSKLRYDITHLIFPNNSMRVFDYRVENELTVVMAGPAHAARLFSEKLGRCCRCFAELTDPRSRHYGIGPECELYAPQIIQDRDEIEMLAGRLPWDMRPVHERV